MRKYLYALAAMALISHPAAFAADPATSSSAAPSSTAQTITSATGATEAQYGGDPNEIICRDSTAVTGTLFKAKVCHTRREWVDSQNLSQTIMRNIHKGAAQCSVGGC